MIQESATLTWTFLNREGNGFFVLIEKYSEQNKVVSLYRKISHFVSSLLIGNYTVSFLNTCFSFLEK